MFIGWQCFFSAFACQKSTDHYSNIVDGKKKDVYTRIILLRSDIIFSEKIIFLSTHFGALFFVNSSLTFVSSSWLLSFIIIYIIKHHNIDMIIPPPYQRFRFYLHQDIFSPPEGHGDGAFCFKNTEAVIFSMQAILR